MGIDPVTANLVGTGVSAGVGLLSGSKKDKSSQTTNPVYDPNQQKLLDRLSELTNEQLDKPQFRRRVVASTEPYSAQFDNQELIGLQRASDEYYTNKMKNGQGQETPSNPASDLFIKNEITGHHTLKNEGSGGKFSPGYYSLEDAQRLGQQGFSAPMSGLMGEFLKGQLPKAAPTNSPAQPAQTGSAPITNTALQNAAATLGGGIIGSAPNIGQQVGGAFAGAIKRTPENMGRSDIDLNQYELVNRDRMSQGMPPMTVDEFKRHVQQVMNGARY